MSKTTGAILLAAGYSRRYGSSKLLAKLNSGAEVIEQTYTRLESAVDNILVVTRPEIAASIAHFCRDPLVFEGAENGMGASLAFAASQLPPWKSVLVCLADMPFIRTETYKNISELSQEDNIVVPTYAGKNANPVAFGAKYFKELACLDGDKGAKALLQLHQSAVIEAAMDDIAILQDIDTPDDLQNLQSEAHYT